MVKSQNGLIDTGKNNWVGGIKISMLFQKQNVFYPNIVMFYSNEISITRYWIPYSPNRKITQKQIPKDFFLHSVWILSLIWLTKRCTLQGRFDFMNWD